MTIEWLEEQLSKALNSIDARDKEINELKDIISELLPIDADNQCVLCQENEVAVNFVHKGVGLCFLAPFYDKAREVLDI